MTAKRALSRILCDPQDLFHEEFHDYQWTMESSESILKFGSVFMKFTLATVWRGHKNGNEATVGKGGCILNIFWKYN